MPKVVHNVNKEQVLECPMLQHIKKGQIVEIVDERYASYKNHFVMGIYGGGAVDLVTGSLWDDVSKNTIKIRLLEENESITLSNQKEK